MIRRRESLASRKKQEDANGSSKSLMDNYFESQKDIQAFYENPAVADDIKQTKSFKIPKRKPALNEVEHKIEDSGQNPKEIFGQSGKDNGNNPRGRFEQNGTNDSQHRKQYRRIETFSNDKRPKRDDLSTKKEELQKGFVQTTTEERFRRYMSHAKNELKRTTSTLPPNRCGFIKGKHDVRSKTNAASLEKINLKRRLYFNQPIEIIIADRAAPNGKISAKNAELFLNEIRESVAQRIPTNPNFQTKFISHKHEDGLITMTCADEFTSVFIQQKLTENLSLWPGAKLGWSFGHFKSCFVTLVVPNSIGHLSEFLYKCKKTDSRMKTEKWRLIECENADDDSGKLFRLAIDKQSYEIIKQQKDLIRCGHLSIKIELDKLNEIAEET